MTDEYLSTKAAATELSMKDSELRAFIKKFPDLAPETILGRIAWKRENVQAVREFKKKLDEGRVCPTCGHEKQLVDDVPAAEPGGQA